MNILPTPKTFENNNPDSFSFITLLYKLMLLIIHGRSKEERDGAFENRGGKIFKLL